MLSGCTIRPYRIGFRIGQGAFGEIYAARSSDDNHFCAIKIEPFTQAKRILFLEAKIMKKLNPNPYFPRFEMFGRTQNNSWLAMELLGPSLSSVVKQLPNGKLSLSTGLRVVDSILKGLQFFHEKGYIHRDVKPSNILLRRSNEYPIAIIDFGLSRLFMDKKTKKPLLPRVNPGFRGTAVFASPNAHMHMDLGRRDDLISWFYLILDLMVEPLPWRKLENRAEIFYMKRRTNISEMASKISPKLIDVWSQINSLAFEDCPNYDSIHQIILEIMDSNSVSPSDKWDWDPGILQMNSKEDLEMVKRLDGSSQSSINSIHEENECPPETPFILPSIDPNPLLAPPATKAEAYNDEKCCCMI